MPVLTFTARQGSFGQTFERVFQLNQDNPFDWTAAMPYLIVAATAAGPPVFIGKQPNLTVTQSDDETTLIMRYTIQPSDTESAGQLGAWLIADGGTWRDGVYLGSFVIEECPALPAPPS